MSNKSKLKPTWRTAIGEVIYIFLGITLAIWFQNWNDNYKEQKQVLKLSAALHSQNQFNLKTLPETISLTQSVMNSAKALMGLMGENYQSKDRDLVDSLMSRFVLTPKFNARQEAIQEITDSGKLVLIKDDSVRYYIIQWDLIKSRTEMMESMNMTQNQNLIMPYLKDHFSILSMDRRYGDLNEKLPRSAFDIDNRKILTDFRFENTLELQFYSINYQHQFYQELIQVMQKLDEHLKRILK